MPSRLQAQDRQRGTSSSRVVRSRGRAAIAALAAIALIAVSCGDDDDDSGAETGSGSEAPADQGGDQSGGAGEESVTDYVAYVGGEAGPADDSLEPINIGWLNQEGGQGASRWMRSTNTAAGAGALSGSVLIDSWSQNRRRRSGAATLTGAPRAAEGWPRPRRHTSVRRRAHQVDGQARCRRARRGGPCRADRTICIADHTRRCRGRRVAGWRRWHGSMPHAGTWRARPLHATAPPAAAARTTTRPSRGRDPQPARVAATSPASARADASSHPRIGERWRWASSVPRPSATSRAPRARAKVLVDARPASVPTQGRNGSVGAAKATTPRAVRTHASTCTAWSLRRSESASTPSS